MDFFESQDNARKRTKWLVLLYLLAVTLIIAGIYFIMVFLVFGTKDPESANQLANNEYNGSRTWWKPEIFAWTAAGVAALIASATLFKVLSLRKGGAHYLARSMGAVPIEPNTNDPHERKLYNVVEEMAIASGVSMPQVYVMPYEKSINAFAAGYDTNNAVVAVSQGAMVGLNRDELQGVVAHEFSHILNGDMRLNLRLTGVLFGILFITIIGQGLLRACFFTGGTRSRREGGGSGKGALQMALIGIALIVVGYIGVFFARAIQSAISRQREYLADSAAVQFTRYPDGIAGALRKIGGSKTKSRIQNEHANENAHLFFASAFSSFWNHLFASHPPLPKRIKAISPNWDGSYLEPDRPEDYVPTKDRDYSRIPKEESAAKAKAPQEQTPAAQQTSPAGSAFGTELIDAIGAVGPEQIIWARAILGSFSDTLSQNIHEPEQSMALLFVLLLAHEEDTRNKQLQILEAACDAEQYQKIHEVWETLYGLELKERLPVLELAVASLAKCDPSKQKFFLQHAEKLVWADEHMSLTEFAYLRIIKRYLGSRQTADQNNEQKTKKRKRFKAVAPSISLATSVLARLEIDNEEDAKALIDKAKNTIKPQHAAQVEYHPSDQLSDLTQLDRAMDEIACAPFIVQKEFLELCIEVIAHDRVISISEAELLRAYAKGIDCPMAPIKPTENTTE